LNTKVKGNCSLETSISFVIGS